MLAFSQQPKHNAGMPADKQPPHTLSIHIMPVGDNANLVINGKVYMVYTPVITSVEALVQLLQEGGEPEHIIYAVIAMLQEMVA